MGKAKESRSPPDHPKAKGKAEGKEKVKPQVDPNLPNLMRGKMFRLDMAQALR